MRYAPGPVGGVAHEPVPHRIPQAAVAQLLQRVHGHVARVRAARDPGIAQQKPQLVPHGEFGRVAKAAVHCVICLHQHLYLPFDKRHARPAQPPGFCPMDGLDKRPCVVNQRLWMGLPQLLHLFAQRDPRRLRQIRHGQRRCAVGQAKHVERPTATAHLCLRKAHVHRIYVRMLFAKMCIRDSKQIPAHLRRHTAF